MNVSIYIFGEFASGYSQFPQDYTTDVFKRFNSNAKSRTQLCVHRDGELIYYAYIRKLYEQKYIGLCAVLNGMMFSDVKTVFELFEQQITGMISRGDLIFFNSQGDITTNVTQLYLCRSSIEQLQNALRSQLDRLQTISLPAVSFGVSKDSVKEFVVDDSVSSIVEAAAKYGYTYIYKDKNYETSQTQSARSIIIKLNKDKDELQKRCDDLSSKLTQEKVKQRNMKYVGILGAIVIVFGIILWNKVLFPSEVTRYETGEFVYYGPLNKNHQPNGIGVAIYPETDPLKRRYYIGNFVNGKREDKEAMLLYQNGDYYYGSMSDDKWGSGTSYINTDNSHFSGEFLDNKPYNGLWYEHKPVIDVVDGQPKYR